MGECPISWEVGKRTVRGSYRVALGPLNFKISSEKVCLVSCENLFIGHLSIRSSNQHTIALKDLPWKS